MRRVWSQIPGKSFFVPIIIAIVILLANNAIALPYFIIGPGSASPVNSAIDIDRNHVYEPQGEMLFTTVSFTQAHPLDLFFSLFDSDDRVEKKEEAIGDATPEEFYEFNRLSMEDSKLTAVRVAMQRAGFDATPKGDGAQVVRISPGSPAEGKLNPGDTIVKVGDANVSVASGVGAVVSQLAPGTEVKMQVKAKSGEQREVALQVAARPDGNGSYVGVEIQTLNPSLDTPFPVSVDLGRVGGPSAGLAMTVALLDELTPGELTGGQDIALTGTINSDGTVGPVGGVRQKIVAVEKRSKAKLFIVPNAELADAQSRARDGIKVVGVDTLDQAIDAIVANGGDRSGIPPANSQN